VSTPPSHLYADYEGASALVHAYLADDINQLRLLSLGGPAEAVRAVMAAAAHGWSLTLSHRNLRGRQPAGYLHGRGTPLHLLSRKLPCGYIHGVLYPQMTPAETRTAFSLLLPKAQEPEAPAYLLRLLDARTTTPLHPSWAAWVWDVFTTEEWLTPLSGQGPWMGWDVSYQESVLAEHLTRAIKARALRVAA
jgi:hypothetical protein